MVFFNRGETSTDIRVNLREELKKNFDNYSVRDVIEHVDMGIKTNSEIKVTVRKHSVRAVVLKFYKNSNLGRLEVSQQDQNNNVNEGELLNLQL